MGPQKRLGIYICYESPTIIKYHEPLTSDMFIARFDDCHFDETVFPKLWGENKIILKSEGKANSWKNKLLGMHKHYL